MAKCCRQSASVGLFSGRPILMSSPWMELGLLVGNAEGQSDGEREKNANDSTAPGPKQIVRGASDVARYIITESRVTGLPNQRNAESNERCDPERPPHPSPPFGCNKKANNQRHVNRQVEQSEKGDYDDQDGHEPNGDTECDNRSPSDSDKRAPRKERRRRPYIDRIHLRATTTTINGCLFVFSSAVRTCFHRTHSFRPNGQPQRFRDANALKNF